MDKKQATVEDGLLMRDVLDRAFRGQVLRSPSSDEIHLIASIYSQRGSDAAFDRVNEIATAEGVHSLRRDQLCFRALRCFTFYQKDMGSLNELGQTRHFIISAPKCGTTSLANQIRAEGHKVFALHNDDWLRRYMPNANILSAYNLRFVEFFRAADIHKPVIYFGFREPVAWYFSLAAELRLQLEASLSDELLRNISQQDPWRVLSFEKTRKIINEIIGSDFMELEFDHELGFKTHQIGDVELVLYRIDALDRVLEKATNGFENARAHRDRVNVAEDYAKIVNDFSMPRSQLEMLFNTPMIKYFYSKEMVDALIHRYSA